MAPKKAAAAEEAPPPAEEAPPEEPAAPIDVRTCSFKDYIVHTGIAEELQTLLLELYKEPIRPENPEDLQRWVDERFGVAKQGEIDFFAEENAKYRQQNRVLEQERDVLKQDVEALREEE